MEKQQFKKPENELIGLMFVLCRDETKLTPVEFYGRRRRILVLKVRLARAIDESYAHPIQIAMVLLRSLYYRAMRGHGD